MKGRIRSASLEKDESMNGAENAERQKERQILRSCSSLVGGTGWK